MSEREPRNPNRPDGPEHQRDANRPEGMPELSGQSPSEQDLSAQAHSPRLADDLAAVTQHRVHVTDDVDRAVLDAAGRRLGPMRRRRRLRLATAWGGVAAAAAAIAIGLSATFFLPDASRQTDDARGGSMATRSPDESTATTERVSEDINADGKVDVLDAFALARHLEADAPAIDANWDVTGDQQVNDADVNAIAQRAVRLNGGQATGGRTSGGQG